MSMSNNYSDLPQKYTQIFNFGRVIDNKDPMNLGRVRLQVDNWQNEDVISSFKNPVTGKPLTENDYWTDVDPLVFMPLLPQFFTQVPKVDESVHVVYYNLNYQDRNKYYIQGMFSSPNELEKETFESSQAFTSKGERNKLPQDIKNKNGSIKESSQIGLYPGLDTIGILGRNNSDMLLPPDAAMLRVYKKNVNETGKPIFNKKFGMVGLQKFDTRKKENGNQTFTDQGNVVQKIKYLVEYDVHGGVGSLLGKFSGYVRIYKISDYRPVYSTSVLKGFYNFPEESLIGPIYQKDFTFESRNDIISGINNVISLMNSGSFSLGGTGTTITEPIPFVFQPSKTFWDKYELNVDVSATEVINLRRFFEGIVLNKQDSVKGIGYVSEKDRLGPLKSLQTFKIPNVTYEFNPITYGLNVANTSFFLSHDSQIGVTKIDFDTINFSGETIPQDFIENIIIPNTNSMVRGEQLLELLELIVRFLITHVHPYHNMGPDSQSVDGTQTQALLTKLFEAESKILNKNLRIN